MSINKDICDEIHGDYIGKNKIFDKCIEDDDKNMNECFCQEKPKIHVNCKLNVEFNTKNKVIYLCPGKCQYFTVDVLKSCGDVKIKYKGCYTSRGIRGNLGIYRIVQSGIFVETYCNLDPRKRDFLNFIAIDECTGECYEFVVVFSCNPCKCCC